MADEAAGARTAPSLSAAELKRGLVGAGEYLRTNYEILNNLNVFPVPDGDTGTNMIATYEAGLSNLESAGTVGEVAESMNEPMTRQSRGNSGFILARFFHGFFEATGDIPEISRQHLSEAFANGSYRVNTSLFSPVEGTMLTIIGAMADALRTSDAEDVRNALQVALKAGKGALFQTPQQLKILAKAGVVDSGGLGFIFLMEGFYCALMEIEMEPEDEETYRFAPDPTVADEMDDAEQMHRYCTEVLMRPDGGSTPDVSDFLKANGTSIALVQEEALLKVHIHTDDPDAVVNHLSSFGKIEHTKIEDMQEQMGLFAKEEDPDSLASVLAFVPGPGFRDLFVSLGIENSVEYSTELPSTAAVLDAISADNSRNVIILPNNKNILPAVMLARDRSDKNVSILLTENVIQGIAAIYGYSENDSMQDNIVNMNDCTEMVESFSTYRSVSETTFDRTTIPEGAYFCVHAGHIIAVREDPLAASLEAIETLQPDSRANICVYHSSPESRATAEEIQSHLQVHHSAVEVELLYGGQPTEYLIVSLE